VRTQCAARRDGLTEVLPNLGPRPASTGRRGVAFVVERHGRFLVRRRPAGVVNAHFWEFPAAEGDGAEPAQAARHVLGVEPVALEPLVTIKHSITRHRIALEAFAVRLDGRPRLRPPGRWVTRAGLERLPFTASHRKILAHLTGHAGKFPSVGRGRFGMQGA
jgi:adenine-specific DNA glycosylase